MWACQCNRSVLVLTLYFSLSHLSGQPNHAEEENCALIRTESSGRWQNRDCSVALPYVCKKRPNATLDPFTTGQCMSVWIKSVKVKYSSHSCATTPQNSMALTFVNSQTRGQMMRSMSATWAGRPSRLAATSWLQRSFTGIQLRKPVRRWRPTWSAYTPYLNWSSSCAAWRKVTCLFPPNCIVDGNQK